MAAAHRHIRRRREPKSAPAILQPTITAGEQRIELQLEGLRSTASGAFLAQAQVAMRLEKKFDSALELLERIASALEMQNTLLARRNNGHDATHVAPQGDIDG